MDEGEFKLVIKELKDKGFIDKNQCFCKSNLAKYPTGFRGKLGFGIFLIIIGVLLFLLIPIIIWLNQGRFGKQIKDN
jgi:competence protein ComGC